MQEVKKPSRRPLICYYLAALLILMLLNMTFFPAVLEKPVQDVTYDQFMSMTYDKNVGQVEIEGDEITFTDKAAENIYRTTVTDDPGRTDRLFESGAQFQEIDTQPGLLTSILVGWVLPLLPFLLIGYFLNRRMKKAMGGDGMMFGMGGGSGAKVYVPSSTGIRFADVAGEDEAKELLSEIVDFLHDPEKYRSDVEKIIESGKTPAGMHIPILVDEILEVLQIQPGQTGYDATLGYGGHTRRMLAQLQGQGHLYATDVDPIEMEKTRARLASAGFGPELLTIQHRNFADVDQVAPGVLFDFVLADLGVSSMQIDDPARGFTFKQDGPLDLRLDPSSGVTAAERLRQLDQEELENLLVENSDEPYADRIAKAVIQVFRRGGTVDTTRQLYALIEGALSFLPAGERKEAVKKSCQRTFQALRIDVNSEFEVLYAFLEKLPHVLKPGGRAAILTFHSGEDRLVKQAFRQQYREGLYSDIAQEVTRPSPQECRRNPRAHSTKLRWAVRAE